ncbi:MAG TPA: hypothetical protein PLO89_04285, partial [Spirochaetota bacterium]|nr:hypothetical protein [Spirochaetota bacterium]
YFPVSLPKNIYPALSTAKYDKLLFRNTHNLGITTNGNYISLYDSPPEKEDYQPDGRIGPYSSCDGYYGEKNSLSLVTEFELKENEGVSVALPINNLEYDPTAFSQIVAAIKSLDLTGNVWVYFDGGLISERFNENETVLQKETLDEGIKYLIDGKYYLYKGRNDGRNQTNDFDNNGILDDDDIDNISPFKHFEDFDNSSDMLSLEAGESKIANFRIVNPDKLKDLRGLRLTVYSPTGAKGKLIINQIRFTESGFTQDKGKTSFAEEIFPAEDDTLINNIFSQKNKDFDARLHFQRDKERTLRVKLKSGEDFSFSKKYSAPIDVSYFKKFGFFIFLKNSSGKTLKTTLIDSRGNEMIKKINLLNYQNNKWHNVETDIKSFENYAYSNKTITKIKFEFINENGNDVFDNDIFIDEIYMEESETFAGFANKNEFVYEDPKAELKTKKGFSIFSAPRLKIGTLFNSQNFLKEETRPEKNFIMNIDSILSFKFVTMDFYAASNLDVFFSEKVYNPNEIFNLKLIRNADKTLPLLFGFIYDYARSGVADQAGLVTLDTKNENRKLSLYLGFKVDRASLKFDYDVDTQKKDINYNNNKYSLDFRFNFEKINVGLFYNIFSKKKREILNGDNSFQNLGYLFSEDFASFYYKSDEKYQYLNLKSNFDLIPNVNFTNSLEYRDSGTKRTNDFVFNAKYDNKSAIDVKINYFGKTNSFFYFEYSRNLENSYSKEYSSIAWEDYFYNFGNNFNSLTPIFFYPPFSSIYKKGGKVIFGEEYRFSSLRDAAGFYFDWSLFLSKRFFLPYKFRFDFIESVSNSLFYKSDYTLTFSLKGEGEVSTNYIKNLNAAYFINQTITLKSFEKIFKTEINFNLNFYLYNNIDLENNISYFLNYSEGITKKEFNHNISFYTKFYKDFYKKNHITEDKEGLDLTVVINFLSNFYHRLDKQSDMISSPLRIYLAPQIGYRFNKNFSLKGTTKFG